MIGSSKGTSNQICPMKLWETFKKAKMLQGFEPYTQFDEAVEAEHKQSLKQEADTYQIPQDIVELLRDLKMQAAKIVKNSASSALTIQKTPATIRKAQEILNQLVELSSEIDFDDLQAFLAKFNNMLYEILVAFPRKDKTWKKCLINFKEGTKITNATRTRIRKKIDEVLTEEQEILDEMYSEALAYQEEWNSYNKHTSSR